MKKLMEKIVDFIKEEDGAIAVEYILLIVFVAFLILAGGSYFADKVSDKYKDIGNKINTINGNIATN
ncbi:Flp family type IVb pilin [Desulfococcus multivorans]|jgi:Flp pilus assembly pilin Flp|uniref:Flp/Fap pilin component n=1 Tax=Desulfococcus multivorans DSM 2059 TaxID=1121405 RepID=S7TLG3_DESML|nr:Flp family type IVb pilin [Desulfococcus multivorans]AOY58734.1 uncharacterized protein, Flp/Fap component [Desulfococcus multivorans]AQV01018.1 hypothetical protein B2D07_09730 [Desulfococcus multivorans]EPR37716.1 Flp/Fap pilin component [Desulfococcus multivorans DSM 2059]SJZ47291.1 Flp pilus assembly protein, pilin Flp [Desulfococcus multivorans DSM 2059]